MFPQSKQVVCSSEWSKSQSTFWITRSSKPLRKQAVISDDVSSIRHIPSLIHSKGLTLNRFERGSGSGRVPVTYRTKHFQDIKLFVWLGKSSTITRDFFDCLHVANKSTHTSRRPERQSEKSIVSQHLVYWERESIRSKDSLDKGSVD